MFPDLSRVTTHPCPLTSCQQYKYICVYCIYVCAVLFRFLLILFSYKPHFEIKIQKMTKAMTFSCTSPTVGTKRHLSVGIRAVL